MSDDLHAGTPRFDYGTLVPAAAFQARNIAERISRRTYDAYIENGRDLIAIKKMLDHGAFLQWLRAEVDISERTAQNLMAAAELVDGKSAKIAVLPVTAIYRLAAPSTPDGARDGIVARVESGEKLSLKEINATIAEARRREAERGRLQRLTPAARRRHQREKKRRQLQLEREAEKQRQQASEAEEAAAAAVDLLVGRLGADLPAFMDLLKRAGSWKVQAKLEALRS